MSLNKVEKGWKNRQSRERWLPEKFHLLLMCLEICNIKFSMFHPTPPACFHPSWEPVVLCCTRRYTTDIRVNEQVKGKNRAMINYIMIN